MAEQLPREFNEGLQDQFVEPATEVYTTEEAYLTLTGKEAPWLSEEKDEE